MAQVKATGRIGHIVAHDPADKELTYKLRFYDGGSPEIDWFSESAVDTTAVAKAGKIYVRPDHETVAQSAVDSSPFELEETLVVHLVNPITGAELHKLPALRWWCVEQLKDSIEKTVGVHVFDQRLVRGTTVLEDTITLSACELNKDGVLVLGFLQVASPKGNCPNCRRADLEREEVFMCDKRGTWWEHYDMCAVCGHRERDYPQL
eukprot:TRINITY_DN10899_c0_g1_i1.p1 TRINITY_DN10899_c0_g1~~TRINITY_DN10899_c0_g1_i1.p1  ORF type:complete len:218 (-),score=14.89 TRINITY_DN10899_c0_g1_i1:384-1001(-)